VTAKPIVPREQAVKDVEAALDFYLSEAGADIALAFINALEAAYRLIANRPSAGSPHYGYELGIPGLRHRRLKRYPFLVFYLDGGDQVEVWRVLHAHRDIPARMRDPKD
jgi:toxin ParE1/3/4